MSRAPGFSPLADLPPLPRVMYPTVTISDRIVRADVTDVDGGDVTLQFRPYQAVRLTTLDCFLAPGDLPRHLEHIYWSRTSPWLDELTKALSEVDRTADFMQRAIHFLLPAGDDVLEVVGWAIHVDRAGAAPMSWPADDASSDGAPA
ncbi:MAG: hypothetical protein ABW328_01550 [Ilumatobacteraceae bacterium]